LSTYVRVLKRRKWLFLVCAVLVPVAAFLFSMRQADRYRSSAEVFANRQNIASAITGIEDQTLFVDEARAAETQANLAKTPEVAERTLKEVPAALSTDELLAATSVEPKGNSDVLTIAIEGPDPRLVPRLTDAYARQFVAYRAELDSSAIRKAQQEADRKLDQLRAAGQQDSSLYRSLEENRQQLATLTTLSTSRLSVVRAASRAEQIAPRPARTAALGLVLGLLLAAGLALLVDAVDTRVRSAREAVDRLGLTLLGYVPSAPRNLAAHDQLVMVVRPTGMQAEAIRMLRTNLEFAVLDGDATTLLITSAVEGEGKSTTVANLAVALARSGKRVALVDLDLRRPYLERFFQLPTTPGLTDVALERTRLGDALRRIDLGLGSTSGRQGQEPGTNGRGEAGTLDVLVSGPVPADPGEFIGTRKLADILATLREHFDVVLLDSPPMLRVGDAMTLSRHADGLIVVTKLNLVRRQALDELRRRLDKSPTPTLGVVVIGPKGPARDDPYGYGTRYVGPRDSGGQAPAPTSGAAQPSQAETERRMA
jgi:Mrp family chromosome partitioning ATPase/capsular polysaccharide biosynthesis protein